MLNNDRIYDVQTRHQIYLEGFKLWMAQQFTPYAEKAAQVLAVELGRYGATTLDQLTTRQFSALLSTVRAQQAVIFHQWQKWAETVYDEFLSFELAMQKTLNGLLVAEYEAGDELPELPAEVAPVTAAPVEKDDATPLFPVWWLTGSAEALKRLWAYVSALVMPANGITPIVFTVGFQNSVLAVTQRIILQGRANREAASDILRRLIGTAAARNLDGEIAKVYNQASAVTDTILQHVSSIISAGVASAYFKRYAWFSVIDAVTTDICRGRNGKIYEYGKGPLPPAHIRCRSKTAPVVSADDAPGSMFAWISRQPKAVILDILGDKRGNLLLAGKLRAKDIPKFDDAKPLTLAEFKAKLGLITTR